MLLIVDLDQCVPSQYEMKDRNLSYPDNHTNAYKRTQIDSIWNRVYGQQRNEKKKSLIHVFMILFMYYYVYVYNALKCFMIAIQCFTLHTFHLCVVIR